MNEPELIKIRFCFPEAPAENKKGFISALTKGIKEEKDIGYAGFRFKKELQEYLADSYEEKDLKRYHPLTQKDKEEIEQKVTRTVHKCHETLTLPNPPFLVYIFPWFPGEDDSKIFGGVSGMAPWQSTFLLLISPENFSLDALEETVAHELNHVIFFHYHHPAKQTIFEAMILEGLAEEFREEVVGGEPSPWAIALSEEEAREALKTLNASLDVISDDNKLYADIFFGAGEHKRWTGYSIGYRIIKLFRKKNPDLPWSELIKLDSKEILQRSNFNLSN